MKRNKTLTLAVSEDDLDLLDRVRNLYPFRPKRGPLGTSVLRDALVKIVRGETPIQAIPQLDEMPGISETQGA